MKAALAAESVRVIAYEPFPDNVRMFRKNIQLNNLENRVEVRTCAIAGKNGDSDLH